jgi:DNA polymerase-3 subunit delta
MVAIKPAEADAFLARPDAARPIVLIHGADAGLVRERVEKLIQVSVDDPKDPFALARLEGDALAAEPARLLEEAHTVPLFGGKRAVWVRAGSRNFAAAVEMLAAAPPKDCRVVIEAGELRRSAPLLTVCEKAKSAVAIACYTDTERDLARLVDTELRAAKLMISADARATLISLIGGDRLASRSEIRKLVLYVHGRSEVTLDDVFAVVADASVLALDAVADAVFTGRIGDFETQFARARAAGTNVGAIVSAVQRHAMQLHKARLALDAGSEVDEALGGFIPRLNFRRRPLVEAALKSWPATRLANTIAQLAETALGVRRLRTPVDGAAEPLAHRALLAVAQAARRRAA